MSISSITTSESIKFAALRQAVNPDSDEDDDNSDNKLNVSNISNSSIYVTNAPHLSSSGGASSVDESDKIKAYRLTLLYRKVANGEGAAMVPFNAVATAKQKVHRALEADLEEFSSSSCSSGGIKDEILQFEQKLRLSCEASPVHPISKKVANGQGVAMVSLNAAEQRGHWVVEAYLKAKRASEADRLARLRQNVLPRLRQKVANGQGLAVGAFNAEATAKAKAQRALEPDLKEFIRSGGIKEKRLQIEQTLKLAYQAATVPPSLNKLHFLDLEIAPKIQMDTKEACSASVSSSFCQQDLVRNLDAKIHATLMKYNQKYKGLCELICNCILVNDLLSTPDNTSLNKSITIKKLDEEMIKESHILEIYPIFRRITAWLFCFYPDNIFSYPDQRQLVTQNSTLNKVNREILSRGLNTIRNGETLKLEIFRRYGFYQIDGHSYLVKKLSANKYIFFDPEKGEFPVISLDMLCDIIDAAMKKSNRNDILFIRGQTYLKRMRDNILKRMRDKVASLDQDVHGNLKMRAAATKK